MISNFEALILMSTYLCLAYSFQVRPHSRKLTHQLLHFGPEDEMTFDNPNDFDLTLGITSHQSSSTSRPSSSTQQYMPDENENRKHLQVWIVDDEQPILDAVGSYLSSSGYKVRSFLNATAPLLLLQEQIPDAVISDVMMPQISGIEFLSVIRSNVSTLNIPFILLTAKGMTEDRIRGYDAGADGYLMKPFDPEELVVMLDQMVQRKQFLETDDCTIEEVRQDLSEVKDLLTKKENLLAESNRRERKREADSLLSEDEMEILELLCEGYMNKEIASELQYSTRWVERHLTELFRKTNCANRTELVRWAFANEYFDI